MGKPKQNQVKSPQDPLKKTYYLFKDLNLKPRQIKFLVNYCTNGFRGREAYKQAGYEGASESTIDNAISVITRNSKVVEGMHRYLSDILAPRRTELEMQLWERWFIQAFYNPEMFVKPDGTIAFTKWEQIPQKYRCCVESIEKKYYGKDANREVIIIKLADQKWAQAQLDKYIGMTREVKEIHIAEIPAERKREIGKIFEGKV